MSAEKLCLNWNDFQENTLSSFKELRADKEFTDVTLACGDGHHVVVHKVVLIMSSPLFQNLLKMNKHSHTLIYMRGVNMDDLAAMMDFLYRGEANVLQENLDSFLALANELQLKGLTGDQNSERIQSPERTHQQEVFTEVKPKLQKETLRQSGPERGSPVRRSFERTVSLVETADSGQLDQQIKSMMDSTENYITRKSGARKRAFICKVCGKEAEDSDMRRHIEANHISNVSHSCDICGKTSRSRNGLRQHFAKVHNN